MSETTPNLTKFKVSWSFEDTATNIPIDIQVEVYAEDEYQAETIGQDYLEGKGIDLYGMGLMFHESWIDEMDEEEN